MPNATTPGVEARYRTRLERARGEAGRLDRRSRALSWARLAAALAGLGFAIAILADARRPPAWALAGGALAAGGFLALAVVHARLLRRLERQRDLAALQEAALARLGRDWSRAPLPEAPAPPDGSAAALARDLDLFGPASLFQLLGTAWTPPGRETLARWLLAASAPDPEEGTPGKASTAAGAPGGERPGGARVVQAAPGRGAPPSPDEVRRRQAAVRELAPRLDERQELERAARRLEEADPDPARFLAWCEGGPWALSRPGWAWAGRLLPLPAFAGLAAAAAGAIPWTLAALPLVVNLAIVYGLRHRLEAAFAEVAVGADDALAYAETLRIAGGIAEASAAPVLRALAGEASAATASRGPAGEAGAAPGPRAFAGEAGASADAATGRNRPAHAWLGSLRRRLDVADARHGSFHVIPQTLVLWDLHALRGLDRWRAEAGGRVRGWLAALGELEALAALAGLAHDQPGWTFPEVGETDALRARALGHPLIASAARVTNDVEVGPPGSFLLVTGSNMAGKSTLLRALGVNAVLALAGGPACAESLALPPLALATAMRTDDSLAAGVSRFMAEALRIRAVVAAAEAARRDGRALFYLLDEALAGTNARERQAALRRVVGRLLGAGAIGAVAGHDLELADTPDLAPAARPVHFRETLHPRAEGGPRMTFDYRLRPGLATTSNALELMELLGLGGS